MMTKDISNEYKPLNGKTIEEKLKKFHMAAKLSIVRLDTIHQFSKEPRLFFPLSGASALEMRPISMKM